MIAQAERVRKETVLPDRMRLIDWPGRFSIPSWPARTPSRGFAAY